MIEKQESKIIISAEEKPSECVKVKMCGDLILAFKAALENGKVIPLEIEQQDNVQKEKNQRKRTIYFYS